MQLDLEILSPPTQNGLDIISLDEMKRHLRISKENQARDEEIQEAIIEAADTFHGQDGRLNRTVFPMTWKRYLRSWPRYAPGVYSPVIELPYPPAVEIVSVQYTDAEGGSPTTDLDPTIYEVVKKGPIHCVRLVPYNQWPSGLSTSPRAVSVTWTAGYTTYPPQLKRAVKMMAAHYLMNPEATIVDRNQNQLSRKVEFGLDDILAALRVPVAMGGWD